MAAIAEPLILSHTEMCDLTGRTRFSAQAKALARMGINYRIRPDGFPVVSRAHFEQSMGASSPHHPESAVEPNWSALSAA